MLDDVWKVNRLPKHRLRKYQQSRRDAPFTPSCAKMGPGGSIMVSSSWSRHDGTITRVRGGTDFPVPDLGLLGTDVMGSIEWRPTVWPYGLATKDRFRDHPRARNSHWQAGGTSQFEHLGRALPQGKSLIASRSPISIALETNVLEDRLGVITTTTIIRSLLCPR
jgi:hypothetical protein